MKKVTLLLLVLIYIVSCKNDEPNLKGETEAKSKGVSTFAGSGQQSFADESGVAAHFNYPHGVVADASGNVYVTDYFNNRIRKISAQGIVTTVAGNGNAGFKDGTGTDAQFYSPTGIAIDALGNLYVADQGNHSIRKITSAGVVTTLAGNGSKAFSDGTTSEARFSNPNGVAVDGDNNVYVADATNNRIRKISTNGEVSTIAGSSWSGSKDGTGTDALFNSPQGIALDSDGNIYVADTYNDKIRKVTPEGVVTTIAGSTTSGLLNGLDIAARFNNPIGIAVDGSGNLYIADHNNHCIRLIKPNGEVSTLAGSGKGFADGSLTQAQFQFPTGITIDDNGLIYVADKSNGRIRKISF